jgi:hypothetical protein
MLAGLRQHLSYANVMATIAVFVALGGSSYAVGQIRGSQIKNRSISGEKLKRNAVGATAVKESSLATVPTANRASAADTAGHAAGADTAAHAARTDTAAHADLATNLTAPERFHEVGAPGEPPFIAGCGNDTANPAFQSVGFYKDREGVVHLKGTYSCTNAGLLAFNLPAGYRPAAGKAHTQAIACFGGGNCPASHTVLTQILGSSFAPGADGGVIADATTAVLDGVSFRAGS